MDTGDSLFMPGTGPVDAADRNRADLEQAAFAQLHYDALAVGETDLRDGLPDLLARMKRDHLPYLAANLVDAKGAHPFPATKVVDTPLGKVGLFAVTQLSADVAGVHAEDPNAAARAAATELRKQGVVAVIGLVHGNGMEVEKLMDGVDVDAILMGHDRRSSMVSRKPLAYGAGERGRAITELSLQLGPGTLVDGNAALDAQNEVQVLDKLYAALQARAKAATPQAKKTFDAQMQFNRQRRDEAQKRASANADARTATWRVFQLDESVKSDTEWVQKVHAEVAADGHAPGR